VIESDEDMRMNAFEDNGSPAVRARKVLQVTYKAWGVLPDSPHAIARRAPHGYVPVRVRRSGLLHRLGRAEWERQFVYAW
jgi:hypothetical protein